MDRGLLDFGLLMEPVDISKYNFVHMPYQEQYRLLVRKDDPMAGQEAVTPEDLEGMDILMPRRLSVRNVFENWFGLIYGTLKLPATINLSLYNTIALVRAGVGKGITPLDVGFPRICGPFRWRRNWSSAASWPGRRISSSRGPSACLRSFTGTG